MSQKFCTQCGAPVPETGNFCPACGAARAPQPVAEQPRQTQTPELALLLPETLDAVGASAKRSSLVPALLLGAALLIGVAAYFAFFRAQPGIANVEGCVVGQPCADETPADVDNAEGIPYPEIDRIAPADAKARFDSGDAVFVDVRDAESYAAAHIPGSVLMPLNEIETLGAELPIAGAIILYCT